MHTQEKLHVYERKYTAFTLFLVTKVATTQSEQWLLKCERFLRVINTLNYILW